MFIDNPMNRARLYSDFLDVHNVFFGRLPRIVSQVTGAAKSILKTLRSGGKLVVRGNGGSASDAQHFGAELAVVATRNAWVSEKVPGFNLMRASCRWSALGVFALWLLVMVWVARRYHNGGTLSPWVLVLLIELDLRNMRGQWQGGIDTRTMFHEIDKDFILAFRQEIRQGEIIAFLPWRNDFMANYLGGVCQGDSQGIPARCRSRGTSLRISDIKLNLVRASLASPQLVRQRRSLIHILLYPQWLPIN